MSHIPFILRELTEDDENFIFNSFLKSLHSHYPYKYVPDTLFYKPQAKVIEFLLDTAQCLVACFPEDPEQIIGWMLYQELPEASVIHYLYIKNQHRKQGIGTDIVKQVFPQQSLIIASEVCDNYQTLRTKIPNAKVIYDPFLLQKLQALC